MERKRPRHPKLGYFINAARKRKQQKDGKKAKTEDKRTKKTVEEAFPEDSSSPNEDSVVEEEETDIESPSYSPITQQGDHSANASNDEDITMDFDINAPVDADGAGIAAGSAGSSARDPRSAGVAFGGGKGSSGGGMRGMAPLPVGIRQKPMHTIRKYTKQYLLRVQNEGIETKSTHSNTSFDTWDFFHGHIRYPLHDLPVHMLGFYLSKSEMAELSTYTKATVKNVKCDVFNKTGVLTFETASSTTNIGNNNIGIYLLQLAGDLNNKRTGVLPNQSILLEEVFWGYPYADFDTGFTTDWTPNNANKLGAQYVRRTLNNKFEYESWQTSPSKNGSSIGKDILHMPQIPYFDIWPFVVKRTNASMTEGHFASYSYQPRNGLVFSHQAAQIGSRILELNNDRMPIWSSAISATYVGSLPGLYNTGGQSNEVETTEPPITMKYPFMNPDPSQYSEIEIENRAFNTVTTEPQPPLVIGIEPLTTEIETDGRFEVVKCHVDLLVQVELDMEIVMGTDYTNPNTFDIRRPDFKYPNLQMYNDVNGGKRWRSTQNILQSNHQTYAALNTTMNPLVQYEVDLGTPLMRQKTTNDTDGETYIVTRSRQRELDKHAQELEEYLRTNPGHALHNLKHGLRPRETVQEKLKHK